MEAVVHAGALLEECCHSTPRLVTTVPEMADATMMVRHLGLMLNWMIYLGQTMIMATAQQVLTVFY
jgi:hypothetical protein